MIKTSVFILGTVLCIAATSSVSRAQQWSHQQRGQQQFGSVHGSLSGGMNGGMGNSTGDLSIVAAANGRRDVDFVEGTGMVVIKVLPDDLDGLRHEKFMVRLSNGQTMLAVYNLDMDGCDKVPVQVGSVIAMGGQFKWTNQGALLHWLHFDPKRSRPDGYVQMDGINYCRDGARN